MPEGREGSKSAPWAGPTIPELTAISAFCPIFEPAGGRSLRAWIAGPLEAALAPREQAETVTRCAL